MAADGEIMGELVQINNVSSFFNNDFGSNESISIRTSEIIELIEPNGANAVVVRNLPGS
jgi:hypothetical protein